MASLSVGDHIPTFTLPDQNGQPVSSEALVAEGPVVLFFYPQDFTVGCTAEACAFRDAHEDFSDAGVRVVGISSDGIKSHADFVAKHGLPYTLLSDDKGQVRKAFGAPRFLLGLADGRVTYVVDGQGVIRHVFNSMVQATRHVQEALQIVTSLASEASV